MLLSAAFNPRALFVTVAAVIGLWALSSYSTWRRNPSDPGDATEEPESATAHAVRGLPNSLPAGDAMSVAHALGAQAGYDYIDGDTPLRALVFVERPGWDTIVFYTGNSTGYTRVHGTYNPTGYDAPRLVGSPPVLAFHSREMDVDFAFRFRAGEMQLEALGDAVMGPGVAVENPTLPGLIRHDVTRATAAE